MPATPSLQAAGKPRHERVLRFISAGRETLGQSDLIGLGEKGSGGKAEAAGKAATR